jgi:tetratricopeptide (TPR) repeat protein
MKRDAFMPVIGTFLRRFFQERPAGGDAMRPVALMASIVMLLGCFACTFGGKTPAPPNRFFGEGARALAAGDSLATKGCYQGAIDKYFKAVELFTLSDDQEALASCFNNIGNLYLSDGKSTEALHYYREAETLHARSGNLMGRVRVLTNMAAANIAEDAPDKAEENLDQAEKLAEKGAFAWPQTTIVRANLIRHRNNAEEALALLLEVEGPLEDAEAPLTASFHFALGRTFFDLTRYGEALQRFSKALAIDRERGALRLMAGDLKEMGEALSAMERWDDAAWHLERALGISTLVGAEAEQKALKDRLTDLAGKTKGNPSPVSGYFQDRWEQGESVAPPCN